MSANCKSCLYWREPMEDSNWSECMLTSPEAHETLTTQVIYIAGTDGDGDPAWFPLDDKDTITAILHTRDDYGCVQYEQREDI